MLKVIRIKTLQNCCTFLENANQKLKEKYEESVIAIEANLKHVENIEKKAEILALKLEKESSKAEEALVTAKKVMEAKKSLELKHERTCHESKVVRDQKAELEKEVNSIKVALKTAQKDLKDSNYKSEKKIKTLEDNIDALNEDNGAKLLEERKIKKTR